MTTHILEPETQATLLLCGHFGGKEADGVRPLSASEFTRLISWLEEQSLSLARFAEPDAGEVIEQMREAGWESERLLALIGRGTTLALAVEQWTNIGLWVMSRADADYPQRWKERLGDNAPVLLYGAGDHRLLARGGVAIVGSREADEAALKFAQQLAERCAEEQMQVVSGGARGVDGQAMQAAFAAGGTVVGVLAEGLAREMVAEKYRAALVEERLTLVSPYHPRAGFSPGNAMERNRYIYALADWAVVVSSDVEKGGTWNGAVEDLKHDWVPLFVRDGDDIPPGNRRLIRRGGIPITEDVLRSHDRLRDWFDSHRRGSGSEPQTELLLVSDDTASSNEIWPRLKSALQEKHTDRELADLLGVELKIVKQWLKQEVASGTVTKLAKPVRYIAARHE